jgi:GST-like protein
MSDAKPLVLYGMGSPNVRKVGIMLEELGLSYELIHVAVFISEQFAPEFLAMNPLGKVPVLVDPALGRPLFESGAILFYLAERHDKFFPADGAARYEVMQWLMVQMALVGPMLGQLNHFRSVLRSGSEPYAEARYAAQSERIYRLLDDRLAVHPWIAGDDYSIADMATYPWALYLQAHGFDADKYPALTRWCDTIGARPAVARSKARFNEAFAEATERARRAATPEDLDRFFGRTLAVPAADFSAVKGKR